MLRYCLSIASLLAFLPASPVLFAAPEDEASKDAKVEIVCRITSEDRAVCADHAGVRVYGKRAVVNRRGQSSVTGTVVRDASGRLVYQPALPTVRLE